MTQSNASKYNMIPWCKWVLKKKEGSLKNVSSSTKLEQLQIATFKVKVLFPWGVFSGGEKLFNQCPTRYSSNEKFEIKAVTCKYKITLWRIRRRDLHEAT